MKNDYLSMKLEKYKMDASFKKRIAQVLVAGSAAVLLAACTNDMQSFQPLPVEKTVVVKDHECKHHKKHHNKHHHHNKKHHGAKHHKKHHMKHDKKADAGANAAEPANAKS